MVHHVRLLLLVILLAAGAATARAQVVFPQSPLTVEAADGRLLAFTVEVAKSADQLAQGLMYRRHMAADSGMLFDFGTPRPVSMWMKNTLIPLDMLFVAADGTVVGIAQRTVPHSEALIESPGPVKAVLELNGGTAARLKLKAGDRLKHPVFGGAPETKSR